jgi:hypothetical protein
MCLRMSLMSKVTFLRSSVDLPRPQTHIFPRVSRLACTAGFTLQEGVMRGSGLPALLLSAQCAYPQARPTHFLTPWPWQSSVTFGPL